MRIKPIWIVPVLLALSAALGVAQVTTGTISGTVTDSSGAVLPSAKVEITNQETGIVRDVTTNSAGHYSAPSLGVGKYSVTATADGFETEVRSGIELTVGREAVVDLKLQVGAVTQSVQVTGEAPLVETTHSSVSSLVAETSILQMPLNGRDLSQLILLNPGVTLATNAGQGNNLSGYGLHISISGLRGESNAYLLDGSYIVNWKKNIPAGPSTVLNGLESVQEFEVLTNSFGAQYGRVLGGVFNAVSKSGTNEWHGDAYDFLRNSDLDARNFFDITNAPAPSPVPPFRRNQFGGTVGGPIKKDKTFFFVDFEGMRESLTSTKISVVPDANARLGIIPGGNVSVSPQIEPYLPLYPLPSPEGINFGNGTAQYIFLAAVPTTDNFGQVRLDHVFSSDDSFFARYTASNSHSLTVLAFPGLDMDTSTGTNLLTLSETHIFSPRALNTARFHFNRITPEDFGIFPPVPPGEQSVPGFNGPYAFSPGSGITAYEGFAEPQNENITNRFNYQDDVNLTLGNHAMQFGGMFERLQYNELNTNFTFGLWTFTSLQNYLAATPSRFRATPPQYNADRGMRQIFGALYYQDGWRVTPRLTVNLGVRWEPYSVPTEVNGKILNLRNLTDSTITAGNPYWLNKSWGNIGPRVGFAWSPLASGKMSIRGGFSELFQPNDPESYYVADVRNPPLTPNFDIPDTGHFPDALAEIAGSNTLGTAFAEPYQNNKSAHVLQYNFTVQQQLGASDVLSIGYSGSRGIDLTSYGDYNLPQSVFYDGLSLAVPPNATVVNPNFTGLDYFGSNGGDSWYNALLISFERRFSSGLEVRMSYSLSKGESTVDSDQNANPVGTEPANYKDPWNLNASKGLSGYDIPQVFRTNFSYDLPFGALRKGFVGHLASGWQVTSIVTAETGAPFTVTSTAPTALSNLEVDTQSPNLNPSFAGPIVLGGPTQYFTAAAYSAPGARELGNVGRNTLFGPGLVNWDGGLFKNTALTERLKLQFRAEVFNVLNRANFGSPAANLFTGTGAPVTSAGTISTTVASAPSREIQFGLKFVF